MLKKLSDDLSKLSNLACAESLAAVSIMSTTNEQSEIRAMKYQNFPYADH